MSRHRIADDGIQCFGRYGVLPGMAVKAVLEEVPEGGDEMKHDKVTDLLISLAFLYCLITIAVLLVCWSFNLMFSFKLTVGVSVILMTVWVLGRAIKGGD